MSVKRIHLAFGVKDIEESVFEYNVKLGEKPKVYVKSEYALWKTEILNLSIRKCNEVGFRHTGFEKVNYSGFSEAKDLNGIIWEEFSEQAQLEEILEIWPDAEIKT